MQQEVMPIYTSEYIPRVKEFYNYSLAQGEGDRWLFCGLEKLNTIRIERQDAQVDFNNSKGVVGQRDFEKHTYVSLAPSRQNFIVALSNTQPNTQPPFLQKANGHLVAFSKENNETTYTFKGYVPLEITLHTPLECGVEVIPKPSILKRQDDEIEIKFQKITKAQVKIQCLKK
jgi:hypothetical protein